jgi:hypothetical protein
MAVLVTVVYAGYANRNWAMADDIALKGGRPDLVEWKVPSEPPSGWSAKVAWRFSKPCEPRRHLPTIFWVYGLLAVTATLTNLYFLLWSWGVW